VKKYVEELHVSSVPNDSLAGVKIDERRSMVRKLWTKPRDRKYQKMSCDAERVKSREQRDGIRRIKEKEKQNTSDDVEKYDLEQQRRNLVQLLARPLRDRPFNLFGSR